ncbi:MAG: 2-oxoacid:ferredoxin oxidoreductase subunit beta [Bacteroidetes bacterium SW_9_63_38]|nr:MAG: 2-oxoacid:ferredoxin oxidoreductase subunit beta [Bacteroidetes bacterium SW_9_63_38]
MSNADNSDGTKKPDLPPSLAAGGDDAENEAADDGTKKPDLPPGLADGDDDGNGTTKPAGPPGAKTPAGPDGDDTAEPTLPPGFGGDGATAEEPELTRKDFQTDQEVRWCPGCGDYVVLAQVQRVLPELDVDKENVVFVSGIGCAGRFPYYMNTYGVHSIHGRAPTFATGLKTSNPELDVWIVTGDGDGLSIGGNHMLHILRRNLDTQILLFNNEIYGLTKGQYSPTSEQGKVTKSTPHGSVDRPVNPVGFALGADASFVARTADQDPTHMTDMMKAAHGHEGTAFIEIYQNCHVFNDGAFAEFTDKDSKALRTLQLEDGEPLTFDNGRKGIRIDPVSLEPEVISLEDGEYGIDDVHEHDVTSSNLARILGELFWEPDLPRPFGIIYQEDRPTYEQMVQDQVDQAIAEDEPSDLEGLLKGSDTWTVDE